MTDASPGRDGSPRPRMWFTTGSSTPRSRPRRPRDSAASFKPVYGQGMSSAALQAAALSGYLAGNPDLTLPATSFFERQEIVTRAAWTISAGGDAARADAISGAEAADDVRQPRRAAAQIASASLRDPDIARMFTAVASMLVHPETLSDPDLLDRAVKVNA